VTPHVAAKVRHSTVDGRTTRHASYRASQRKRKLIEEAFGWAKTIAGLAKVKVRGLARVVIAEMRRDATRKRQIVPPPGSRTEKRRLNPISEAC
jgi:hypothetical protein